MIIKFNINTREFGKVPAFGYPIPDSKDCPFHLVIHFRTWLDQETYGKIVITDFISGSVVGHGETLKDAIHSWKDLVVRRGYDHILGNQKKIVNKYGAANRLEDWK